MVNCRRLTSALAAHAATASFSWVLNRILKAGIIFRFDLRLLFFRFNLRFASQFGTGSLGL